MRIALYGLPCAGKSFLMDSIRCLPTYHGSSLLVEIEPDFHEKSEAEKDRIRRELAFRLSRRDNFVMDGHYAFGDKVVFTEADGALYDAFLYLNVDPTILRERMIASRKNSQYSQLDLSRWQRNEIAGLRSYCQTLGKDFYVLDDPDHGYLRNTASAIEFISAVVSGFSVQSFAEQCAREILAACGEKQTVCLVDGDGTLSCSDTCASFFGYETSIFDGNFYTGYQSWLNQKAIQRISDQSSVDVSAYAASVLLRESVQSLIKSPCFVLTTGYGPLWSAIASNHSWGCFYGAQMCADAKLQIVRLLHTAGKSVLAIGDSMNDYFMLREADEACLVMKRSGQASRSLIGFDTLGFRHVCA